MGREMAVSHNQMVRSNEGCVFVMGKKLCCTKCDDSIRISLKWGGVVIDGNQTPCYGHFTPGHFAIGYLVTGKFVTRTICYYVISLPYSSQIGHDDVIEAFEELTDDNDFPQELVSYFETYYIGEVRGRGQRRRRVEPVFPIQLWNVHELTKNGMPRTNNYLY